MGEAGGTEQLLWRHPKARFFGAPPRFFAQEQRNGVELAAGGIDFYPRRRRTRNRANEVLPFLCLCTCAPIRWEVVVSLSCDSTPFLWCLPKETVSSRQRKALFYPGGSTIRVSATASVVGTHLRPTWGRGGCLSGGVDCRTSALLNFHARFARRRKKSPVRQDGAFIH